MVGVVINQYDSPPIIITSREEQWLGDTTDYMHSLTE